MPTEQLIVEFIADTKGLESGIEYLVRTGAVDKANGEIYKKTTEEIFRRTKAVEGASGANEKLKNSTAAVGLMTQALAGKLGDLSKNLLAGGAQSVVANLASIIEKELAKSGVAVENVSGIIQEELDAAGVSVDELFNKIKDGATETKEPAQSLKAQLRQMKEELNLLDEAGKSNTAEFEQLAVKAAKLEDQLGDTSARIKALASDTRYTDSIAAGFRGVAAAFGVAQGASSLFGKEQTDVQAALLKVQSSMAVLQGITELQNLTQKEGIAVQAISIVQRKAQAVSVQLETAAESRNIVVKYAATAAQWALNAAMTANPIGILLAGIVAVTSALIYFTDSTEAAADAQKLVNEESERELERLNDVSKQLDDVSQKRIAAAQLQLDLAKAGNTSTEEQIKLQKQLNAERVAAAGKQASFFADEISRIGINQAKIEGLKSSYNELAKAGADEKVLEVKKKEIDILQKETDKAMEVKNAFEDATAASALYNKEAEKILQDKANKEAIAATKLRVAEAIKGSKEELESKIKAIATERDVTLQNADLTQSERLLIIAESNEKIKQLNADFLQSLYQQQVELDNLLLRDVEKNSSQELAIKLDALDNAKNAELAQLGLTESERALIKKKYQQLERDTIKEAQQNYFDEQIKLDQSSLEARLATAAKGSDELLQIQKDLIENKADAEKLEVQNSQMSAENKARLIKDIDTKATAEKKRLDDEALQNKLDNIKKEADAKTKADEEELDRKKKLQQAIQLAEIDAVSQISEFAFNLSAERNRAELDDRLSMLSRQKDSELSNKNLTEDQKKRINDRYAKEEARLKTEAAKKQREADILQAVINGLLGATRVAVQFPPPSPEFFIGVGQVALTTALNVAAVAAKPLPKYASGTRRVVGPGSETSDSIPSLLSKNEGVFPADINLAYDQGLTNIFNRRVSPEFANKILTPHYERMFGAIDFPNMNVNQNVSNRFSGATINEDKLAQKIAFHMMMGQQEIMHSSARQRRRTNEILSNIENKISQPQQIDPRRI